MLGFLLQDCCQCFFVGSVLGLLLKGCSLLFCVGPMILENRLVFGSVIIRACFGFVLEFLLQDCSQYFFVCSVLGLLSKASASSSVPAP